MGASSAKVALCRLQVVEDHVTDLLREFPRTPSARGIGAEAEACMQRVHEQAERILAPMAEGADQDGWTPPTQELRNRVEQLLRGKLVAKMLAGKLRRLLGTDCGAEAKSRIAEAQEMLLSLRGQLRRSLEDAMLELRKQVNELVPPSSDED